MAPVALTTIVAPVAARPDRRRPRAGRPAVLAGAFVLAVAGLATSGCATGVILSVGPGRTFTKPCQAIAAAKAGDTIEIDAAGNGSYDGDVCQWSTDNLTIRGVNGRAHIDAAGHNSGGKATWVISGNGTTVSNVELSGAAVPDQNGAGIRLEGAGLTVVGSSFHDNQDGILANANPTSDVLIDSSEFAHNGAGDGFSHNMYIGNVRSFTLRYSWSHDVNVGHLVKSRAVTNHILYNRLTEQGGNGSYELDLPNAGLSYVIGNLVQQGPATQNPTMFAYGEEGASNPSSQLYLVNNTFVNDKGSGASVSTPVSTPVVARNNLSTGSSTFVGQAGVLLTTNCVTTNPGFVDRAGFDYHLTAASSCVNAGSPAGTGSGEPLAPDQQYVYDTGHAPRTVVGPAIDAGGLERP